MSSDFEELKRSAAGQWAHILRTCGGLTDRQLDPRIGQPCPKCGGDDRFSAFADVGETGGLCCRVCFNKRNADGFSALQWLLERPFPEVVPMVANAIGFHPTGRPATPKPLPPKPAPKPVQLERQSFDVVDSGLVERLEASGRDELAKLSESLGVSVASLQALGAGFSPDDNCWTLPERTADGEVCGINRRFRDGQKKMMSGHKRGLTFANDWQKFPGPALIVEGFSDTAAAITTGACAIGRPAAIVPKGLLPELITMLKSLPQDRGIIVVGENDQKEDGDWPGKDGAIRTARELTEALGRPVAWALPPDGSKDLRNWLQKHPSAGWHSFVDALTIEMIEPEAEQTDSQDEQATTVRTFAGKSAADLWDIDDSTDWLVEDVFSADQPTIVGAKQKSLKTTLLTDLAVSLASGYAWLGKFVVPRKRRVLFVTGEASEKAAIKKVRRAADSRNLRREDFRDSLRIEALTFPTLPSPADCLAIGEAVKEHGIEIVLLDPLYMGLQGLNTANLNEVGPVMRQFMAACRPAKVIIAHHVKKSASFDDAPNLEDLSQAGIAEFAGNYWLMGRMKEYTGEGLHELAIRYGGRDEQFGLLKLDFDERSWKADFSSLMDHREDQKQRRENERIGAQMLAVKSHLSRNNGQATLAALAEAASTKPKRESFQSLIDELCEGGNYERFMTKGGNNKPCEALRVKGQKSTDSVL